ncbi:MAG: hypothetical protein ABSF80_12485 [Chitinispirillaceae bacterium]|jgi:hypothetical protein
MSFSIESAFAGRFQAENSRGIYKEGKGGAIVSRIVLNKPIR